MWYTPHIAQLLLIVASFNKQICMYTEAFKVTLRGLNKAKARVYATLCLGSDIRTCSELSHAGYAAHMLDSEFYPIGNTVLNEFKCVCGVFSHVISGLIWSTTYTKFACCNFKLR